VPIPTDGAWPPPAIAPAYQAYRDFDAWYDGRAEKLRQVYSNRGIDGSTSLAPSMRVHPGQYAGGLVGTVSRWLWGSPPPGNGRDGRLHAPLPADLARTVADLLFSEPPTLSAKDAALQGRLEQLVGEDGLHTTLLHAAEAASVLGDVYLTPVVDRDLHPDRAFLAAVHADGAIPVLRWGRLVEVTFWSTVAVEGSTYFRHLEHHEVVSAGKKIGQVVHALHEGTVTHLGRAIALTDRPETAHIADQLDAGGVQLTGLDRLDVIRIPNAGPQRRWRTQPGLKYLGRSDFDGSEQQFDALDDVWTSWLRDIRLGRGRIVVPEYMLQSLGAGQGAVFDAEREIYSAVNSMPNPNGQTQQLTVAQFDIRFQEHQATAEAITKLCLRHAGLSAQTMGDQGDVAQTATEVQARERMSFQTRGQRIEGAWKPGLKAAVELLLAVEAIEFGSRVPVEQPDVEFGDSVSESPETVARTLQLIEAAGAASVETKVRMLHPDWDDADVKAEVDRIRGDQPTIDVAGGLGGLAGNQPPSGRGADDEAEEPAEPEE
jgi:A118 family predicted phage portal protein